MTEFFDRFEAGLIADGLAALRDGQFGRAAVIDGPFGPRRMIYADDTASGRALRQVEAALQDEVLPYYANSHTEASHCGARMTALRRAARDRVARGCGAGPDDAVIFTGNGATAGINRLVHLLGVARAVAEARPVRVLIGPWEHHSNILPWRESGARVIELPEGPGGVDMAELGVQLAAARRDGALCIGAFSAASNVTGALADVAAITAALNAAGALSVWDQACGAPYLPLSMTPGTARIDAMVLSPHKFAGGPGASGVTVIRRGACGLDRPVAPGGGTVRFVGPTGHDYSTDLVAREESGTPDLLGDIRAGMAFAVKSALAAFGMARIEQELAARGLAALRDAPGIELLGCRTTQRLPIFSLRLRDSDGAALHQQLATRMLSDLWGIQARGGCACAGPYVHRLLGIDAAASAALRARILSGEELAKPGFVRFNLGPMMTEAEIATVLEALRDLPGQAARLAGGYDADPARAIFRPVAA